MDTFDKERKQMVAEQLSRRDIYDPRVLDAMRSVPRHLFVPPEQRHLAYRDGPLPIGSGQTISQPYIVALMTQLLELQGNEKVLEVGTGSGYQAAVLGCLAEDVHTIERHTNLAGRAVRALDELGYHNVHVHVGDGTQGLAEFAPYQAILVTAAAPKTPRTLLEQLTEGGRLVIPVGAQFNQMLMRWQREGPAYHREVLVPVAFVPLRGEHGWRELSDWEESF